MSPELPEVPGYDVEAELGRGGMGVVYQARRRATGTAVALKVLLGGRGATFQELARFRVEAEALACLDHPNIIKVHDIEGGRTALPDRRRPRRGAAAAPGRVGPGHGGGRATTGRPARRLGPRGGRARRTKHALVVALSLAVRPEIALNLSLDDPARRDRRVGQQTGAWRLRPATPVMRGRRSVRPPRTDPPRRAPRGSALSGRITSDAIPGARQRGYNALCH
jgi:hypothetical protein